MFKRALSAVPQVGFSANQHCGKRVTKAFDDMAGIKKRDMASKSVTWRASTSLHSHGKQLLPIATDGVPL